MRLAALNLASVLQHTETHLSKEGHIVARPVASEQSLGLVCSLYQSRNLLCHPQCAWQQLTPWNEALEVQHLVTRPHKHPLFRLPAAFGGLCSEDMLD